MGFFFPDLLFIPRAQHCLLQKQFVCDNMYYNRHTFFFCYTFATYKYPRLLHLEQMTYDIDCVSFTVRIVKKPAFVRIMCKSDRIKNEDNSCVLFLNNVIFISEVVNFLFSIQTIIILQTPWKNEGPHLHHLIQLVPIK